MLSRRGFLSTLGVGAGATLALRLSPGTLQAWAEPQRVPQAGGPILLDSNENAYGAFASALAAAQESLGRAMRYPDEAIAQLTQQLAAAHKVTPEQVILGTGSAEVLRAAAEALTAPNRKLVMASPTFEAIGVYATLRGHPVVRVPLRSDFAHDTEAMAAAAKGAGLVYVCNPNNPTASVTSRAAVDALIARVARDTYVLVDEAYHHFAGDAPAYKSFLDVAAGDERVIVTRTFSKIYGMAGLRLGYGIAAANAIEQMRRRQAGDNINVVALAAGAASLDDVAALRAAVDRNARDRTDFMVQAAARKLTAIPSFANFVMLDAQRPAQTVIEHFRANGVRIGRRFPPLETHVRVSLGKPDEMRRFWEVWDLLPSLKPN